MTCITSSNVELPEKIVDLGTLNISIDNRGIVRLSITILTKNTGVIFGSCSLDLGGTTFNGTIVEDTPKELVGTEYYEHHVVAVGMNNGLE